MQIQITWFSCQTNFEHDVAFVRSMIFEMQPNGYLSRLKRYTIHRKKINGNLIQKAMYDYFLQNRPWFLLHYLN